jgi:hypothetical protein
MGTTSMFLTDRFSLGIFQQSDLINTHLADIKEMGLLPRKGINA